MHFSLQHVRSTEKSGSCTVRTNITRAVSFLQRLRQFTIFYGHTVRTTNLHGPCGARCELSLLSSQASINTDRPTARIFQNHSKFSKPIFVAFLVRPAQEIVYPKTDSPASASVRQAQPPLLIRRSRLRLVSAGPPRLHLCTAADLAVTVASASSLPHHSTPSGPPRLSSVEFSHFHQLHLGSVADLAAEYLFHRNPNRYGPYKPSIRFVHNHRRDQNPHGPYNTIYGPCFLSADTSPNPIRPV